MKRKIIGILVCMLLITTIVLPVAGNIESNKIKRMNFRESVLIQSPEEEWNITFGGNAEDYADSVQQTTDGGYIITGITWSYGAGSIDAWLIKTDTNGVMQWNKTFGGVLKDKGKSVLETNDGGYIIGGEVESYGAGQRDFWLIKTDADGNEQWNKTFGGTGYEFCVSVQQTLDSGYILTGPSGGGDVWLIKTDANGIMQWNKTFGGANNDGGNSVQQTTDGGYIITGTTESFGAGTRDVWLIKTDTSGNDQWNKTFGGTLIDGAGYGQQITDGGYILIGYTESYGEGDKDVWLIKTDENGNEIWNKTFGGTGFDIGRSGQQTSDGEYIITGSTGDYEVGNQDVWLIKTDENGNEIWNKTFGETSYDVGFSCQQTTDDGYIIAGSTKSYGAGDQDVWLIKVASENQPPNVPTIDGKTSGKAGKEYEYTFNATDPDGNDVRYIIDWGDNTSNNTDFKSSGIEVMVKHTWSKDGTYNIIAKAQDIYGLEGPEGTLTITIPRARMAYQPLSLRLFERFPNVLPILRQLLRLG